ncbi:hypothetical protein SOPP22_10390 [Shewanella sp. OPT22]|nr:hypothetical protein SOPP22_10390 [Shewanella sp. OPT22]
MKPNKTNQQGLKLVGFSHFVPKFSQPILACYCGRYTFQETEASMKFIKLLIVTHFLIFMSNSAFANDVSKALKIATAYLINVEKWKCGEFIVEHEKFDGIFPTKVIEKDIVHIRTLHKADMHINYPGGGKSLALKVNLKSKKVISALAYQ